MNFDNHDNEWLWEKTRMWSVHLCSLDFSKHFMTPYECLSFPVCLSPQELAFSFLLLFFVFSCQQCWLITLILIHSSVNTFSCWGLWYIPGTLCMRWECSLNGKPVNRKTSCTQSLISRGNLAQPIHLPACFWEVGRNWSVWRNPHRYSRMGKTPHKQ